MSNTAIVKSSDVKITIGKYIKPRKKERTWSASKYSIFNIGAQAMKIGYRGIKATPDMVG